MAAKRASRRASGSGPTHDPPTLQHRLGLRRSDGKTGGGSVGSVFIRVTPERCSRMYRVSTSQTKIARASHLARNAQGGFMRSGSVHRLPHNRRSRSFEDVASTARESRTPRRQSSNLPASFVSNARSVASIDSILVCTRRGSRKGGSPAPGLGLGVSPIARLSDDVEGSVPADGGTRVRMTSPYPRRRAVVRDHSSRGGRFLGR
jgi:hypothetical protein